MDHRLFFPATQRNKKYIGDVLSKISLKKGTILEIGSGSGEHGIEFQKRFPEIIWQTSDPEMEYRKSISCLLYTSPSPRDGLLSRMPSSA